MQTSLEKLIVDRMAIQHLRMLRLYENESIAMKRVPLNRLGPLYIIPHLDRPARDDVRIERQLRILHNRLVFLLEWRQENPIKLFPTKE